MLNVLLAEIGLHRSRIDAAIGQLVTAGVAQHVGMDREIKLRMRTGRLAQGALAATTYAPRGAHVPFRGS